MNIHRKLSRADYPTRMDNPHFRSKEIDINTKEKKGSDLISSSSDINRELQLLGIGEEEIERILEKIDDDDKLKLLKEKINLINHLVTTETINNTAAYAIKVIKSTNFNQVELRKAEKRKKSILSAEKRKRDIELMKKERKEWNDDIERRKEETGDISDVVSDFTEKMNLNKKIGGVNV